MLVSLDISFQDMLENSKVCEIYGKKKKNNNDNLEGKIVK